MDRSVMDTKDACVASFATRVAALILPRAITLAPAGCGGGDDDRASSAAATVGSTGRIVLGGLAREGPDGGYGLAQVNP